MSKRNRIIFSVIAVLMVYLVPAKAQEFSSVSSKQLGEKINIEYAVILMPIKTIEMRPPSLQVLASQFHAIKPQRAHVTSHGAIKVRNT